MNVAFDTNVLLRILVADNPAQLATAQWLLSEANTIALPLVTLCEAVWVLTQVYKLQSGAVADMIADFVNDERVTTDFPIVEAGLVQLRGGGDFADAVIALDGKRLGAQTFATFDKVAAKLLKRQGIPVTLLS